ncbi:MAG: MATE family efflux transporter [Clostridia bacterium]|nr:MATE family efflux transporter [Clostridia bacterium]
MRTTDMTRGSPARLLLSFALPMMAGNIFQQLYTIVDAAFVGRFAGIDSLAAVGAADWFSWMVFGVVWGYTQGFSILISQRFGAGDLSGLRRSIGQSLMLTALITGLLTVVSQAVVSPVLSLLGTPDDIRPKAALYLRILFGAMPVMAAYNAQAAILRAMGDAKTPLAAMTLASLTNIALDALFVIVLHWGVAGAAAATVIAQGASAIYCFSILKKLRDYLPARADWKPCRELIRDLIRLGTPTAAQNVVIGVGGLALQRVINGFGSVFIAGFTATNKLYGLMEMAAVSYGGAIAAYAGQNAGARLFRRIQRGIRSGALMAAGTALAIGAVLLVTGRWVLSLFVDPQAAMREQVLDIAQQYLFVMLAALFVLYLLYVYRSALQGMGDTVTPMLSGVAELIMRVGSALILPSFLGYTGVFLAEPAAWLGAELLLMITYYRKINRLLTQTEE